MRREWENVHIEGRVCLCTYVNCIFCRKCLRFLEEKKGRKRVFLSCGGLLPLLEGDRTGLRVLGDEGSLGEEAAFLFLGLAIDGDLNCHLGCVLEDGVSRIQQIFLILLEHT